MAQQALMYELLLSTLANKEADLNSDTIKCLLCTSSYTPDQGAHQYKSSLTNEVVASGYTAGGVALTSPTFSVNTVAKTWTYDAGDAQWTTVTFAAGTAASLPRYAVIYDSTPATDATRPLIAYIDFGVDQVVTSASFTVQFNAAGILVGTIS